MFTHEDRKRSDAALDRASHIGEAIGVFLHNNGKGLIKGAVFLGCVLIAGGVCLLWTLAKRTVLGKK